MRVKKQRIIFGYILLELLLLNLSLLAVLFYKSQVWQGQRLDNFLDEGFMTLSLIYNVSWVFIILVNGNQDLYVIDNNHQRIKNLIINCFVLLGMSSTFILLARLEEYSLTVLLGPIFLFSLLDIIAFAIVSRMVGDPQKPFSFGAKLLVLGAGTGGKQVLHFTERNKHLGYTILGFLDDHYPGNNGINLLGKIHDLPKVLDEKNIDEIVITLPLNQQKQIKEAIEVADYRGVRVNIVPEYPDLIGNRFKSYNLGSMPVLQLKQIPLDHFFNFILKKTFDIVFASFALLMLSPILLTIAALIKLGSKGPVFYKPVRKGQCGTNFTCYKFRSMYVDASKMAGTKSTTKDDPRVTKIGKILRKYSLDELPQFINVLKGDMSVVGPRPHRLNLNDEFQQMVEKYMVRHYVKPGITGWAQVNGWRGPTETDEQKLERVRHDLFYIENWSFWLDVKCIWLTVFGKKVHQNAF
ncbi:undecaprenyl-phosphate glucose phosphotransferase [Pontibacter sp. G13]|uniref:undecaprenyl-phosphate glucose phosphotransferase n=1 Tax=Pontibacter sp. G13 TaxID=3074898 RepID=UPI002889488B|nr:undecaprenyl-phosphate glucose phosphotransferase [Pontibacter sp. G13]WNJ19748.1 undecaprenyl-phosphate glucose phosphotransferase [Pontibacter sp. G13]